MGLRISGAFFFSFRHPTTSPQADEGTLSTLSYHYPNGRGALVWLDLNDFSLIPSCSVKFCKAGISAKVGRNSVRIGISIPVAICYPNRVSVGQVNSDLTTCPDMQFGPTAGKIIFFPFYGSDNCSCPGSCQAFWVVILTCNLDSIHVPLQIHYYVIVIVIANNGIKTLCLLMFRFQ